MGETYYEDHKFEQLRLENETLEQYTLIDCTFIDCTFDGCALSRCVFSGCQFEGCNIINLKSESSQMKYSDFANCTLTGIDWRGLLPSGKFAGPISKLQSCHIKYNTFTEMKLHKFNFSGTKIVRSMFAKCDLGESSFRHCDLSDTEFFQCDIRKADFREAAGYHVDILSCQMKAAKFTYPDAICLLDVLGLKIE